jgi:apolipoprotein D and lipocalin family protein
MKVIFLTIIMICYISNVRASEPLPIAAIDSVDLERYSGVWHEIARLPNKFQRECDCNTTAEYSLLPDGKIRVVNRCRKVDGTYAEAEGIARKEDNDSSNAKLKVRFAPSWLGWLPFVWGTYWIIDLAPDYSYAVVGEPSRKYLWVLARAPKLDDAVRDQIMARLKGMKYDTEKIMFSKHE